MNNPHFLLNAASARIAFKYLWCQKQLNNNKMLITTRSLLFFLSFIALQFANAELNTQWTATHNGTENLNDEIKETAIDRLNNIYVTGVTGTSATVIKYSPSGQKIWEKVNLSAAGSSSIAVDDLFNLYVSYDNGIFTKYDASGNTEWELPGTGGLIKIDNNGDIVLFTSRYSGTNYDFSVKKLRPDGTTMWSATHNGPMNSDDFAVCMALDTANNIYVSGNTYAYTTTNYDIAVIKYSAAGSLQYIYNFNGSSNASDISYDIAVDKGGNAYACGSSYSTFGSGFNYITFKLNPTGAKLWEKIYHGGVSGNQDIAHALTLDDSSNVYVTGEASQSGTNYDYVTIKYSTAGTQIWLKRYAAGYRATQIISDDSANIYVSGSNGLTLATVQYSRGGTALDTNTFSGFGGFGALLSSLSKDYDNNVLVAGSYRNSGSGNTILDYLLIKFSTATLQPVTLNINMNIEGFYDASSNNLTRDTVTVYLRNSSSPYALVDSSKSYLSIAGAGTFPFTNAGNGISYFLQIRHRNSIDTWSMNPQVFTGNILTYDFTTASSQAFGSNMIQVDASPVRFAIYGGDVNQDGTVDATDVSTIDNDASNFISGYVVTDLTGDEFVDGTDFAIADNNAANFVSVVSP